MNTELLESFKKLPPQQQTPPGEQEKMRPKPLEEDIHYIASEKLKDKVAITEFKNGGIMVVDLESGAARLVLNKHYSVKSDPNHKLIVDGAELMRDGKPFKGKSTRTTPYTIYRLKAE
jgi:hypothetical protein